MQSKIGTGVKFAGGSGVLQGAAFALLAGLAGVPAWGAPLRVQALQDQRVESSFALDFGPGGGGVASARISDTAFELEIDGLNQTARFVNYNQNIAAILLPGGLDTGAIHVEVVPNSSSGTYNRTTGEFTTSELYSIEFEGNLEAFGLVSPVVLPSQSVGIVDMEAGTIGRVTMNWAGTTNVPFDISYICTLFASFASTPASFVEVDMMQLLLNADMSEALRDTLKSYLELTIGYFNAANNRAAADCLRSFIYRLRLRAAGVDPADALALVEAANTAIGMVEHHPDQVMIHTDSDLDETSVFSSDPQSKNTSDRFRK